MNPKFTSTPPTEPGFYAVKWVQPGGEIMSAVLLRHSPSGLVDRHGVSIQIMGKTWPIEWCRLVPAEEIEKAWDEAKLMLRAPNIAPYWSDSRAKKVMEGKS